VQVFPISKVGDTFTGEYKFCSTSIGNPVAFECIPDRITFVVKDANFALENTKRYQNIIFEGTVSIPFPSFIAVGVYDRCNGQGTFYEEPVDVEVFPGLDVIQLSQDGQNHTQIHGNI
jgi:hypothetical protein